MYMYFHCAYMYMYVVRIFAANSVIGNADCTCPEDILVLTCIVDGGVITLWRGTAFSCPTTNNEILLRHTLIASRTASGACNNGAIVGRGLGEEDNVYTSQLNVTVSSDLNSQTIECAYDDGIRTNVVFTTVITVLSG